MRSRWSSSKIRWDRVISLVLFSLVGASSCSLYQEIEAPVSSRDSVDAVGDTGAGPDAGDAVDIEADTEPDASAPALTAQPASVAFVVGETAQLTATITAGLGEEFSAQELRWSSADTEVATIDSATPGSVELFAVGVGTTTVSASIDDGHGGQLSVEVPVSVSALLELSIGPGAVFVGDERQAVVTATDAHGNPVGDVEVSWAVEDAAVLSVDGSGMITALDLGATDLIATVGGQSSRISVEVVEWKQIEAGRYFSCGLLSNGDAYCWGQNGTDGMLGHGTVDSGDGNELAHDTDAYVPTPVLGGIKFESISLGHFHSCGLTAQGQAYCWGAGYYGQLGNADYEIIARPVAVSGAYNFVEIEASREFSCALEESHDLYCWGYNASGELGQGDFSNYAVPKRVLGHKFVGMTLGGYHACAISEAGPTFCWGSGTQGQLGDGGDVDSPLPVQVDTSEQFVMLAGGYDHTCGLNTAGEVFCWGHNDMMQLGDATTLDRSRPVRADPAHTYVSIAAGAANTCGLDADDDVYCWGHNSYGNLGNGGRTPREESRVLVTGGERWRSISLGARHSCALPLNANRAYCWGLNYGGPLGNGENEDQHWTPQPVVNP
ncbi:Ig-like domain-containing protein [Bradymonas sediminis]|uniref:RCC1 domain-containing protein n=1 Tax=Bradymonas sediminis TaxID=1548548 RepID=UPI0010E51B3A|nr:Ig-like domain-containing protein [Bradymonas sediminis]TDP72065.1 alpha-tubulin suppressor-like RCC1 family protein [Bradymonas sediminis]